MVDIKPLIMVKARHSVISGGYYRLYEILKNGKSEGINYVIVTDPSSYRNYVQMFPDVEEILKRYKTYCLNYGKIKLFTSRMFRDLKAATPYWGSLISAMSISKIAQEENVDLIVGPSEITQMVLTCYLSSKLSRIPWTAIFQGTNDLLQPTQGLGPLNPLNILRHVSRKKLTRGASFRSKIGFSLELLGLLKIAEKSLILTVSHSLREEIRFLNPKIKFHVIAPGNGVDLEKFSYEPRPTPIYDAIFFSRLIPEKGLFDLPEIWKLVTKRFPKAVLAVAGTIEDSKLVKDFQKVISYYGLTKNVLFLGPQDRNTIADLVRCAKLTIYPSSMDAFPLVVLESLACGTPVVSYDILAVSHNFRKCKAVLMCSVKDIESMAKNILLLLENEDLRAKLSSEAKEYASNFDWKKVVRAEREAYFKVIEWFNSR